MNTKTVSIQNEQGFHARLAQQFVQESNKFQSDIKIRTSTGNLIDAKSILGLMTLGLGKGAELTIQADGPDEEEAVNTLVQFVESKSGE